MIVIGRKSWIVVAAAALGIACDAPAPSVPDSTDATGAGSCVETESAVREAIERLIAADNAEDLEASVSMYTREVEWLPPDGEPLHGRETIRGRYEAMFAENDVEIAVEIHEIQVEASRASVQGSTTGALRPKNGGEPVPILDSFLMMLECEQDGAWRVSHLAWAAREETGSGDAGADGEGM